MQGISQKRYIRYRSTHDPPESAETGNLCRRSGPHGHMWPGPARDRLGSVNGTFTTLTAPTSRLTSTPGNCPGVKTRHTSLNTHTGTRLDGAPGREAQPSRYRLQTPYGYHTPDNIPSFFKRFRKGRPWMRKQHLSSINRTTPRCNRSLAATSSGRWRIAWPCTREGERNVLSTIR
jgi:hypothetical protein